MHLCFNLFFGCLSFYNTTRRKRANCVMGLAIFFLVYSFFRTFAIVIKLVCSKEESFDNKTLYGKIKEELEKEGEISSRKDEDMNSEEKKIKSRDFNENEENDGNENIQNNEEDDNNNEHNENNNSQENQNDGENDG